MGFSDKETQIEETTPMVESEDSGEEAELAAY